MALKRTDAYPYGTLDAGRNRPPKLPPKMIDFILANQFDDGGWNLQPKEKDSSGYNAVSDVDMTGMAMIALAPYMKQAKVKKAIDRAIPYLSKQQKADGWLWQLGNGQFRKLCAGHLCADCLRRESEYRQTICQKRQERHRRTDEFL